MSIAIIIDRIIDTIDSIPYAHLILGNRYIVSIAIILLSLALAKIVLFIFRKYVERFAQKTSTKVDDLILQHTKSPIYYLILAYGIKLALLHLNINGYVTKLINSAMALVFLLIILRVIDIAIEIWSLNFTKKTKTVLDDVLLPLLHKITKVLFVLIGFLWVLKIWQIDITPYLAGVGISGIVLGLALQDSLKNVFGGVAMILDRNFQIGDVIKLESGDQGTIIEIGLRSTKLRTQTNETIFVPNGQLSTMRIYNLAQPIPRVRKIVDFSVEYGTPPEHVKKVVLKALKGIQEIYDEPYMDVIMIEMGDYGLKFQGRFWVDWPKAYDKWAEATETIYNALTKAKIGIPYPTQTLHIKNYKEAHHSEL